MTRARRPSARTVVGAAVLAAAALLAAACSDQAAGSAALVGDSRITEQQLNDSVQEILTVQQQPVDSTNAALTSQTLSRMITLELVDRLAAREGVVVSQGEIDAQLAAYDAQAGSRAAVETTFAEQGVAPSQIAAIVRLNLQAQALGLKLDPQGTAEEQGQAVFEAVGSLSTELDVAVSPRFGTWDAATLNLGPVADDVATVPSSDG